MSLLPNCQVRPLLDPFTGKTSYQCFSHGMAGVIHETREAAVKAIETLDVCIGRVVSAMQECGGEVLITADHGNAEQMIDRTTHQAHTAHTLNRVPFLYIGRKASMIDGGALKDVAPTLLAMMGLQQPPEMTGKPLIKIQ